MQSEEEPRKRNTLLRIKNGIAWAQQYQRDNKKQQNIREQHKEGGKNTAFALCE